MPSFGHPHRPPLGTSGIGKAADRSRIWQSELSWPTRPTHAGVHYPTMSSPDRVYPAAQESRSRRLPDEDAYCYRGRLPDQDYIGLAPHDQERARSRPKMEFGSPEEFEDPRFAHRRLFAELLGTFLLVLVAPGGGVLHP